MQVVDKNIKDLVPYEKNPRNNDEAVKYVAESIKEFGFKVPIVVDESNVIVAGHTRYKAAKQLKLKSVPCIVASDLTEDQIKAYRLADNKVGEYSDWDYKKLSEEMSKIVNIDMNGFGFLEEDYSIEFADDPKKDTPKDKNEDVFFICPKCSQKISEGEMIWK